jgi:hypothetical protein
MAAIEDDFRMTGPSDAELDAIEQRCNAATPEPWVAWIEGRDHTAGDTFIAQGGSGARQEKDLFLSHYSNEGPVSDADHDFIAHARQDLPLLLAEVRRLRGLLAE